MYSIPILILNIFRLYVLADYNPYGFMAYLFNSEHPQSICTGVIVSDRYILNFCLHGSYKYNAVKIGIKSVETDLQPQERIYNLTSRQVHPDYNLQDFPEMQDSAYNHSTLFASQNAIFLDRTEKKMDLSQQLGIWPINLARELTLPKIGLTHYFKDNNGNPTNVEIKSIRRSMQIIKNSMCNKYYAKYRLSVDPDTQYCAESTRVRLEECCNNHAIMEHDAKVIGIMAWSTACSGPPEPWVFTHLSSYYQWITDLINEEHLFS